MSRQIFQRGSVSIEAVILIPVFLGTIFITMEASLWVYVSSVAQAAAQDGVRAGTALGAQTIDGERMAEAVLHTRDVGDDWRVTTQATPAGLTMVVTGRAPSVIPGFTLDVQESATLPWEGRR